MTDPVLAALLDDPTPTGRLVAADRAAELGDELLETWLRLMVSYGSHPASEEFPPCDDWHCKIAWRGDGVVLHCDDGGWNSHRVAWEYSADGWRVRYAGRWYTSRTPPPGLEAAVLAVLRRRLQELQHV